MIPSAWLRLLAAAEHGGRRWRHAVEFADGADNLLKLSRVEQRRAGLTPIEIDRLDQASNKPPAAWLHWLEHAEHDLIVVGSERYPPLLAAIDDAPLALWVNGKDPSLLLQPQLAIVGSRNPTHNGRMTAEALAASVSAAGIGVTSGLALGIDAASHAGALGGVGKTIAVLGNGIDTVYPKRNGKLAAMIQADGLIVSEYPPQTPVRALQFPRRNRIIAALGLGTLVVEASLRSGSLITARLAAEFGREVFAVPGSIHSALSKGCHKLLQQGAKLVESVADILLEIAPQLACESLARNPRTSHSQQEEFPRILRNRLDFAPISLDSLIAATGLTAAELSSMLLQLEIQGKIEALPGGRYCRLEKRA